MYYDSLKKLDEESSKKLEEGPGPAHECICHLFTPPAGPRGGGFGASIRRALGSIGRGPKRAGAAASACDAGGCVTVPLKGGHAGIVTTKRVVQRKGSCGKCGCDKERFVLKDSDVSIRITTPDISTFCPCPSDCLPDKAKLQDKIRVAIEYLETPEPASSWVKGKYTKDQFTSTLGQTRAIRENKKQKSREPSEEEDAVSKTDVKDAIVSQEDKNTGYDGESSADKIR